MISEFSTEYAPAGRRAGLFKRQMASLFSVGLSVAPASEQPLRTQVLAYCSRRLQFAALRFSPHSTSGARVVKRHAPRLLLTVNKEGPTYVSQDGRESSIGADDIFLIDPSRPFHIESGEILTHSVYLPAAPLRALIPRVDAFTARAIDGRKGAGAVFRAMLDELFAQAPTLSEDEADGVADILPHALAAALATLDDPGRLSGSSLRLLHKQRIKRFARENLSDPDLDVRSIALAVDLSPRHVYELFSDEPLPLMKWIWNERLEQCRRELSSEALRARPVGEIAYSWGFSNVSHFSRSFRTRYGASPRETRGPAPPDNRRARN
jgi:AraC-like DNA-binding protein